MKKNNEEENILALGEKQIEIIEKKEKTKIKKIPIFLVILGIILMITGYFFDDIINILGIDLNSKTENKVNEKYNDNELICTSKKEDLSLGIVTTIKYTYTFNNKLLQKLIEKRTISSIENSDIGPDNLKVIRGKYTDIIEMFKTVPGISINSNLNKNVLTININYDYNTLDNTKIPQNNKVGVNNFLNETKKSVKQKIANDKDTLCK